ncbi:hypothetical protein VNO77_43938 [Canavalia gladiata]|uniref:Uncharacterized protein n=1 Tax=Canavalia gladiata TaxID=3824 RepID=A0AAN9JYP9_CANGL
MAGASAVECGMDIEEWERKDLEQHPPPHLLAEEEGDNGFSTCSNHNTRGYDNEEQGVTFTNHQGKLDSTKETICVHNKYFVFCIVDRSWNQSSLLVLVPSALPSTVIAFHLGK